MDDFLDKEGFIYLDPHDHVGHLEKNNDPFLDMCQLLGVNMSSWT
jgi:hypothetical protein